MLFLLFLRRYLFASNLHSHSLIDELKSKQQNNKKGIGGSINANASAFNFKPSFTPSVRYAEPEESMARSFPPPVPEKTKYRNESDRKKYEDENRISIPMEPSYDENAYEYIELEDVGTQKELPSPQHSKFCSKATSLQKFSNVLKTGNDKIIKIYDCCLNPQELTRDKALLEKDKTKLKVVVISIIFFVVYFTGIIMFLFLDYSLTIWVTGLAMSSISFIIYVLLMMIFIRQQ